MVVKLSPGTGTHERERSNVKADAAAVRSVSFVIAAALSSRATRGLQAGVTSCGCRAPNGNGTVRWTPFRRRRQFTSMRARWTRRQTSPVMARGGDCDREDDAHEAVGPRRAAREEVFQPFRDYEEEFLRGDPDKIAFASAISTEEDIEKAADECVDMAMARLPRTHPTTGADAENWEARPRLAIVFASTGYRLRSTSLGAALRSEGALEKLVPRLRQRLPNDVRIIGCTGAGVIGTTTSGIPMEVEANEAITRAAISASGSGESEDENAHAHHRRRRRRDCALSLTLVYLPGDVGMQVFQVERSDLPGLDARQDAWHRLIWGARRPHAATAVPTEAAVTSTRALAGAPVDPHAPDALQALFLFAEPSFMRHGDLDAFLAGMDFTFPHATKVGAVAAAHSCEPQAGERADFVTAEGVPRIGVRPQLFCTMPRDLLHPERGAMYPFGCVGVALTGNVAVDALVVPSCRPIGPTYYVRRAMGNLIYELENATSQRTDTVVGVLRDVITELDEGDRRLVANRLLVGVAQEPIGAVFQPPPSSSSEESGDERRRADGKRRPSSADGNRRRRRSDRSRDPSPPPSDADERLAASQYAIRQVFGVSLRDGAVAIANGAQPGQRLRLFVMDAAAARSTVEHALQNYKREQLTRLLSGQANPPVGACVFPCMERGELFFRERDVESFEVSRYMSTPVSGVFCGGEIGPFRGATAKTHLHEYASVYGILRARYPHPVRVAEPEAERESEKREEE
ncbi:hypothetical protein CDCA_CDCA13G3611 [Cyanidium caldarium]|uniref:FIST C-domain domain-containing protein n=1 Tax=Cyanidium caldarium TaxID=2771 RepID=A0AAV9IZM5_CYACA|nr:hypothetical protein CDCA_CDCA13G3611 [Cyanidium caldarium]